MGPTPATIYFGVPDLSCTPERRAILTVPPEEHFPAEILLHDFSTSSELTKGVDGLDVQGFTYLKHHSKIQALGNSWDDAQLNQYHPELEALMCEWLGARKAFVINTVVRRVSTRSDPRDWVDRDSNVGKDQESRRHDRILGNLEVSRQLLGLTVARKTSGRLPGKSGYGPCSESTHRPDSPRHEKHGAVRSQRHCRVGSGYSRSGRCWSSNFTICHLQCLGKCETDDIDRLPYRLAKPT